MKVAKNQAFFIGAQTNEQAKADEIKRSKKNNVFAGSMNEDLLPDSILEKKKEAQKKAMQVVGDAWKGDRKIDEDLQQRRDLINALEEENKELLAEVSGISLRQEELKQQYGITEDSKEQQDLELLLREKKMLEPGSKEKLTEGELQYVQKLKAEGLTEYQKRQIELDSEKSHYQSIIDKNKDRIIEENAIIRGVKLERLKRDPMVKAQKEAEEIKEAATDEIMGMLIEAARDHIDEKSEEAQEKADKLEEQQEKMEEFIEAQKEKREETDKLLEKMPVEEMVELDQLKDEVKQEVQKIVNDMKLVVEDIKGAMVDKTL